MKYEEVLNKIKLLRKSINISQDEMANYLEIDRTTYNHYENNYHTIPIKHMIAISNYFQVSIDYIFGFTIEESYSNLKSLPNKELISKNIKNFRKINQLTQEKLAKILNTNQSVIANYERGRNYIATPFLYTICKKYGVSADYLLRRINYQPKL